MLKISTIKEVDLELLTSLYHCKQVPVNCFISNRIKAQDEMKHNVYKVSCLIWSPYGLTQLSHAHATYATERHVNAHMFSSNHLNAW
jgi:hypothetical protein